MKRLRDYPWNVRLGAVLAAGALIAGSVVVSAKAEASTPSATQLQEAATIASSYWQGPPPCGAPTISFGEVPAPQDMGYASFERCEIVLRPSDYWFSETLCMAVTHEWGHLVLGPTYFAATNPSDPAHSPEPTNIMSAQMLPRFGPCEAIRASTAPEARSAITHRRHHHGHHRQH